MAWKFFTSQHISVLKQQKNDDTLSTVTELYHGSRRFSGCLTKIFLNCLLRCEGGKLNYQPFWKKKTWISSARNYRRRFNKLFVRIVQNSKRSEWIRGWENWILQSNESGKRQREKQFSCSPLTVQCAFTMFVWGIGCFMVNDILFGCSNSQRQQLKQRKVH